MSISHWLGGFAGVAFIVAAATPAWAQEALSLQEAQRLALARSQQIVSKEAERSAAGELRAAAGQLPDPVLKLGVTNLPLSGPERLSLARDFMTMRSIGIAQEITRSDKRRLRAERLQHDERRLEAERLAAASEVQRSTALAWIERYYAQAAAELMRRQLQQASAEVQGAEIGYRNGRGSQSDVFAARSAVISLQDKLRLAERQVQSASLSLARWVGPHEARRPLAGAAPWRTTRMAAVAPGELERRLPQLAALAAQVEAAETEVRLAQAGTRSDWTVEAMYSQRGPAYSDMVSVGVSVPLQLDRGNRQDRQVAAKVAALAQARASYEDALRSSEAEIQVLLNDWSANKERIDRLGEQLLPTARLRTEAALTAYGAGRGELASVLAARRQESEAALQVLELEMETARLWAQLNDLIPDLAAMPAPKEQP